MRSRGVLISVLLAFFLCEGCSSPPGTTAETAKPAVMADKPFAAGGKIHVELDGELVRQCVPPPASTSASRSAAMPARPGPS